MNQHVCWICMVKRRKNAFWLPGVMHIQVIGIRTEWILQPRCTKDWANLDRKSMTYYDIVWQSDIYHYNSFIYIYMVGFEWWMKNVFDPFSRSSIRLYIEWRCILCDVAVNWFYRVLLERSFKLYTNMHQVYQLYLMLMWVVLWCFMIRDRLELDQHQHISAPRHSMEIECKTQRINTVTNVKTPGRLRCPCAPETPLNGYYICVIICYN